MVADDGAQNCATRQRQIVALPRNFGPELLLRVLFASKAPNCCKIPIAIEAMHYSTLGEVIRQLPLILVIFHSPWSPKVPTQNMVYL